MENYEALGKYVAHKEKAMSLAIARNNALKDLIYLVKMSLDAETSSMIAVDLNFARAKELLEKAADAHNSMVKAVAETNAAADGCGHTKLMIGK